MRFFRFVLCALLLMMVLLSATTIYSRATAKPNKLQRLGFDVCNDRPCFLGITLGMSWANANAVLAKKKELISISDTLIGLRIQNIDIGIRPDNSQTHVDEIDFLTLPDNDPQIPLSTVVATLGPPCSVTIILIENQVEWVVINYPEIQFTTNGVSPNSTITTLTLSNHSDLTYCASKKVDDFRANPWRGFRDLSYYMVDRSP